MIFGEMGKMPISIERAMEGKPAPKWRRENDPFGNKIGELIEQIIGDSDRIQLEGCIRNFEGCTNKWEVDFCISKNKIPEVIIECKGLRFDEKDEKFLKRNRYTYHTHMCRAYTRLNDLRMKYVSAKFFIIVNRDQLARGESPKIDNRELFKSINVNFININDEKDRNLFIQTLNSVL